MNEERKDAVWFEWYYQVSSLWRIKTLERIYNWKHYKSLIIKQRIRWGYCVFHLWDKWTSRTWTVHRLVAQAFIPNPENKRTVNHKDWNKLNNNVENLEWSTDSENCKHRFRELWQKIVYWWNIWKPVIQKDLDWNTIDTFPSMRQAHIKTWILVKNIRWVCRWLFKQTKWYIFEFTP